MRPIIRVEGLSKLYYLGGSGAAYSTLRETLMESLRKPVRYLRRGNSGSEKLWALSDVSFEVTPGDVVGIIGRNGAGKSTLLKVLSRIVEPTSGRVELYGRVASLPVWTIRLNARDRAVTSLRTVARAAPSPSRIAM